MRPRRGSLSSTRRQGTSCSPRLVRLGDRGTPAGTTSWASLSPMSAIQSAGSPLVVDAWSHRLPVTVRRCRLQRQLGNRPPGVVDAVDGLTALAVVEDPDARPGGPGSAPCRWPRRCAGPSTVASRVDVRSSTSPGVGSVAEPGSRPRWRLPSTTTGRASARWRRGHGCPEGVEPQARSYVDRARSAAGDVQVRSRPHVGAHLEPAACAR